MNIQDALKETGKVHGNLRDMYVELNNDEVLCWYDISGSREEEPVSLSIILKNDWQPYHPKEEIRPKEAGELWKHDDGICAHTSEGNDCVWLYVDNCTPLRLPVDFMEIIHGKNGWTRIHPPVPDDNMEEIVIEGVTWFKNEDEVVFPCQDSDTFIWGDLLKKPPITMTLRYKKEKP